MVWVIICTIGSVIIVNTPLVYILFRVHHPSGLSQLWGYAPNQFLFPLLAFPMAAFATFLAMKLVITTLQQSPPQHQFVKWSADNWIVVSLVGIILASSFCIIDYFSSVKTFDKLQPVYAKKAITAAAEVRRMLQLLPKDSREEKRLGFIQKWRDEKENVVTSPKTSEVF